MKKNEWIERKEGRKLRKGWQKDAWRERKEDGGKEKRKINKWRMEGCKKNREDGRKEARKGQEGQKDRFYESNNMKDTALRTNWRIKNAGEMEGWREGEMRRE